jgi:hypothetical protein
MLAVSSYKPDYVQTCHANIAAQLDQFRALPAGKPKDAFAAGYFNAMLLVLDSYFLHRQRSNEGKNGGPLNELRMLCDGIKDNAGVMGKSTTIKYRPEKSITGTAPGETIRLDAERFEALADAVFGDVLARYP